MDHCDVQNDVALVCGEEMRGSKSPVVFPKPVAWPNPAIYPNPVACPKPRRVGCLVGNSSMMTVRRHKRILQDLCDSKAGVELFDMILAREANAAEKSITGAPLSPPFFSGSPPSRVSNPLVLDSRFRGVKKGSPSSPLSFSSPTSPTLSPSARKGGCARGKFGLKPAAVRVEGFDCLSRDRSNSSITAVA
ncbi:hypothetical protein AKJ16_DCAP12256 [Drosera capensis]